jgi:hypothetical protein
MGKNHDWGQTGPLGDDSAQIDDQLLEEEDGDGLEAGIAAVFEAIRNGDGDLDDNGEDAQVEDNGATFALLSELNRLWERPQA